MSDVGKLIGLLLSSREQAHVFHLVTKSFAIHKAMQTYYEGIGELVDTYSETYMGRYKKRISGLTPYINKKITTDSRVVRLFFVNLLRTIKNLKLPVDRSLVNIRDDIETLITQTIYMLSLK